MLDPSEDRAEYRWSGTLYDHNGLVRVRDEAVIFSRYWEMSMPLLVIRCSTYEGVITRT